MSLPAPAPTVWQQRWAHVRSCFRPWTDLLALVGIRLKASSPAAAERIDVLTGVRALALLWVLAFHAALIGSAGDLVYPDAKAMPDTPSLEAQWLNSWITQPILNGDLGVDVFFTLSGMLITTMFLRETAKTGTFNYPRFILRRYMRLAPMLVVGILVDLLAGVAAGHWQAKSESCAQDWWKILLMFSNYSMTCGCLDQAWSVAVEFQLYLLAPAALYAAWSPSTGRPRRLWWLSLAAIWAVSPLSNIVMAAVMHPDNWYLTFNMWGICHLPLSYTAVFTRASPFVAGMAAALAVHHIKQHLRPAAAEVERERDCAAAKELDDVPLAAAVVITVDEDAALPVARITSSIITSPDENLKKVSTMPAATQLLETAATDSTGDADAAAGPGAVAGILGHIRSSLQGDAVLSRCLLACADLLALGACVALAFLGGGENRHTRALPGGTGLDNFIMVLGRPLFGAALAWVLAATLLGRCRAIGAVLSWKLWLPACFLSYGAYLVQGLPRVLVYNWTAAGATTLFAGWAVYWFEFAYFSVLCLLLAVPFHLTVENPFHRVVKSGY